MFIYFGGYALHPPRSPTRGRLMEMDLQFPTPKLHTHYTQRSNPPYHFGLTSVIHHQRNQFDFNDDGLQLSPLITIQPSPRKEYNSSWDCMSLVFSQLTDCVNTDFSVNNNNNDNKARIFLFSGSREISEQT